MREFFGTIWEGWKKFAKLWGKVVNAILLTIVYFTLFGLTSLLVMATGQDLLHVRPRSTESSVWEEWEREEQDMEDSRRQF